MPTMGRRRTKNHDLPPRLVPRKRRDGTVAYYYDHGVVDGKRWREPLGKDLTVARRLWAEREYEGPPAGTFAALAQHYLEHGTGPVPWRRKPLTPRGIQDAKEHITALNRVFANVPADQITPEDVSRYLSIRSAPVRANREIACMSSIYKHGQRTQQVTENPTRGVPRNAETPREHVPSDFDFIAVRESASEIVALGMDFAYLTGMRLGDMLRLPVPREPDGIHYRTGKTGQAQIVEWDDALRDLVHQILALRKVSGMTLFATRRGQPYSVSGWESMWQRVLRKAEAEGVTRFRWHDIRAKAATDASDAGQDSRSLLGHRSERQHLVYLRSRRPMRAKPVKKLDTRGQ